MIQPPWPHHLERRRFAKPTAHLRRESDAERARVRRGETRDPNDVEAQRLALIERRDGPAGATEFAHRTMCIYRKAVLDSAKRGSGKPHFASTAEYRRGFIKSYLAFKRYLSRHRV